ncbi:HAD family phosphatase [Myxosarcina sp. GI1]|uniref:HAD family hydrolase n=1 Tax=Myxosarcina sp. GI1 TaxID=1541065 RepID=UPI0006893A30|nr:HAD family hydrolase [Myxosarcina sp. GI1]
MANPNDLVATSDPLPSWREGQIKSAILDFVQQATTKESKGYIPPGDRTATFDNDGTLWCEQPLAQGMFVISLLKKQIKTQPELAELPVVKALLKGDYSYFDRPEAMAELVRLLAEISANISQAEFEPKARAFLETATHPQYKVKYTELAYQPQVELLTYLRANGFQTWICTGGGIDFVRLISEPMYGIIPQQVIGSYLEKEYRSINGSNVIWRLPKIVHINDRAGKPVGIDRAIGQPPVFACGNVRNGGDIAMLTYSQSSPYPNFQLLIDHDDREREFAYSEPNNASLNAARPQGWQVVSMKNDWRQVFAWQ